MTYTFAKAHNGEIGDSIVELDKLDVALNVEKLAKENNVELVMAPDATCTNGFDFGSMSVKDGAKIENYPSNEIPAGWEGLDAGPEAQKKFAEAIKGCKTILWNGPADSVACCTKFGLTDKVSYISTGGGALLEAIEGKVLPGVAAIQG